MIKLSKIYNEITLGRGMASESNIYEFAARSLWELDVDLDSITDKFENRYPDDSPELYQKIKKQGLSHELYNKINRVLKYVGRDGQYRLGVNKARNNQVNFYLVDDKAKNPGEFFVGVIETIVRTRGYRINLEKAFGLVAYEVHWSFVPKEVQGTGMGKRLYSMVFDYINSQDAVMYSDEMLYEGSFRMWKTYMPTIADYFGIQFNNIMLPCSAEEVASLDKNSAKKVELLDGFIAMNNPPKLIRKMAYNTTGLSFFAGEFGMITVIGSVNDKVELSERGNEIKLPFYNAIKSFDTVKHLVKSFLGGDLAYKRNGWPVFAQGRGSKAKCVFLSFEDAILCAKDVGGEVVIVAI